MRHTNLNQFLIMAAAVLLLAACDQPAEQQTDSLAEGNSPPAASSMPEAPAVEAATTEAQGGTNGEAAESPDDIPPTSDVPPPSREVFADAECNFEDWVGKPVDEEAVKATGRKYRIMTPEQPATMDFNQERINVIHDDGGKVVRVFCG